jgi:hypothetical protein
MNTGEQALGVFMEEIGKALKAREGVDVGLAEIISKHILAAKRGDPSEESVDG